MGLFDYVNFSMDCPSCKKPLRNWQTKDGDGDFDKLEIEDLARFYALCECGKFIEFYRNPPRTREPWRPQPATMCDALALGFVLTEDDE